MSKTKASLCVIAATLCTVIVLFVLPITPKVPVSTAVIEKGSLIRTQSMEGLICYGNIQACLTPLTGQIAQIYAKQGESVQKGDVLVRLDTGLEEKALGELTQALYQQKAAVDVLPAGMEAVQAVWLQSQLELEQRIQELSLMIEAKTIRASADGVVGQVYGTEGGYAEAFSPLMSLHGDQVELYAQMRAEDSQSLKAGMRALVYENGMQQAVVTLKAFDAPSLDQITGSYTQALRFEAEEGEEWLLERMGETVAMEVVWDVQTDKALAPLAAVSHSNQLWVVDGGKASPVSIDPRKRDADYVSVPEELAGQTVILLPDDAQLYPGCLVKEAKK